MTKRPPEAAGGIRERLLSAVASAEEREREMHDAGASAPAQGGWTAKDHVAHLAFWRDYAAGVLDAARTERPVERVADEDAMNAEIYAANRDRPPAEIVQAARESSRRLAEAIERASEDLLRGPDPRHPGQQLWEMVVGNLTNHEGQHLSQWHRERGDLAAAEEAQKWTARMATAVEPSDRQRGAAAYNLGCFYAQLGRTQEAVAHVKEGLALRPDLLEWARQDSDLDPIRNDRAVKALLDS